MSKVYVVSGFYYFSENCFELDEIPVKCSDDIEKASEMCLNTFLEHVKNSYFCDEVDLQKLESKNEYISMEIERLDLINPLVVMCTIYNNDNGDRIIVGLTECDI